MRDSTHEHLLALMVTRNFPPLVGGMEKLNWHLLAELGPQWRLALCGPAGCKAFAPSDVLAIRETAIRPLPWFLAVSMIKAVWLALRLRPKLVLAGSGLTAPVAWLCARLAGARLVTYVHGLDLVVQSRVYQWCWLPFIRASDLLLANSAHTAMLATSRGIAPARIAVLHPGTGVPPLDPAAAAAFRARHALGDRPLLLSVGRLTRRKGLAEFVAGALPMIVAGHPAALLLVVGDEASDALHGSTGSERERILAAARAAGVESNLRFLGRCDETTLQAAYQASDCHVFPVLELPGDVEGFGMVALESAAHGLQTVAFAVGGVPDAIAAGRSGFLIEAGRYTTFADAVLSILGQPAHAADIGACREFASANDWDAFGRRLRQLVRPANG
jgi:phosphatidyl-myo-inositol dimannoside synthase